MGDDPSPLIDKFLFAYRTLELTTARVVLDEIDTMAQGRTLPQACVDRLTRAIFPMLYPGDKGVSRLGFSIQCAAASYMATLAPSSRPLILQSILDIFAKFPHVFAGATPIRSVLNSLAEVDNFWELLIAELDNFTLDFGWCFFLMCVDSTNAKRIEGYDIVVKLLSNNQTFANRKWPEILEFLNRAAREWGPNSAIAQLLIDYSLEMELDNDIPKFLYQPAAGSITVPERVIDVMSRHCSQVSPQTARVLALIVRNDGKFKSRIFQIALYLALLKNSPATYTTALVARIKNVVSTTTFEPACAAHIVAIASSCQVKGFSFLEKFCSEMEHRSDDQSLFFAYLADCAEFLNKDTMFPVLIDALESVAHGRISFGICKFISSLLDSVRGNPQIENDPSMLVKYIEPLVVYMDGGGNAASMATSHLDHTTLPAKIIAKIVSISGTDLQMPIDVRNFTKTRNRCAICAYALNYSQHPVQSVEYVALCSFISDLFGFTSLSRLFRENAPRVFGTESFPPPGFMFNHEYAELLTEATMSAAFKEDKRELFAVVVKLLETISDRMCIKRIVNSLWSYGNASMIPPSTLLGIVQTMTSIDCLDDCRAVFVGIIREHRSDLMDAINECFSVGQFRGWFVSRVLSTAAVVVPEAFKIARKMTLTKSEFCSMIPALEKVMPYTDGPLATRAEGMKLIAANSGMIKELAAFNKQLAVAILSEKEKPEFPESLTDIFGNYDTAFLREVNITPDNRRAAGIEIGAALYVLGESVRQDNDPIDEVLREVHGRLYRSKDPGIRLSYLKFLGGLGIPGIPYACEMEPVVSIPFFI